MTNQNVISDWFHQYSDDVYNFLIYLVGRTDVEDLVQEVFIRALKGIGSFQGNSNPRTWLFSIARNLAIDEIRMRNRNKWKSVLSFETSHEPSTEVTPEVLLDLKEENKELYRAIQSLKSNFRDVIILRGIKGLSVQETSEVLAWSENKTRSTYHRAKIALQKRLGGALHE
ncbi:RNA polymerase sigma factor [Ferdinandcohnia quinoae]|uniref:RNA polymerase sigma factor n=1 Tax=Fredinandcohnia quinoae TaxID=2918902 RepID=A0AAW5E8R6_9BACI|nr:RNA polymerase sigma factor [Fredinandcohnia sp. SECRCQ15]MCH1626421.1 RNA polymerase sigma factor [Fredinandcohnia sp. SECRCQ15]